MDFIDLDEEQVVQIERIQSSASNCGSFDFAFPRLEGFSSSLSRCSSQETLQPVGIFIRNDVSENGEVSNLPNPPSAPRKEQVTIQTSVWEAQYDPKGPFIEGRNSRIFCGSAHDGLAVRKVAIKLYCDDDESQLGAEKEVQISKLTIGQPGFIEILAHSSSHPQRFALMDWIDGGTLDRALARKQIDPLDALLQVSASVSFLHTHNIIHHDLKPQNILVNPIKQQTFLIDFGDAKLDSSKNIPLQEGIGLGTLAYTAPELLVNRDKEEATYDPFAADVYSFGVLAYYILNEGKVEPFSSLALHRAVHLILTVQKGFFAAGYNAPLSLDCLALVQLVNSCLSVNPLNRPRFPHIYHQILEITTVDGGFKNKHSNLS